MNLLAFEGERIVRKLQPVKSFARVTRALLVLLCSWRVVKGIRAAFQGSGIFNSTFLTFEKCRDIP